MHAVFSWQADPISVAEPSRFHRLKAVFNPTQILSQPDEMDAIPIVNPFVLKFSGRWISCENVMTLGLVRNGLHPLLET